MTSGEYAVSCMKTIQMSLVPSPAMMPSVPIDASMTSGDKPYD